MNKEYNYIFTCSNITRLWSGTIKYIGNDNKFVKDEVLDYLNNEYKDAKCKIFINSIRDTKESKCITHQQKDVLLTSVFYK